MKAAYIESVGPPENIKYGDLPEPVAGASQVLVKVSAVAVNPVDTYIRSGALPMKLDFPFIIGRDMVGAVTAVGADVKRFARGDRVWCNNRGYDGRGGSFAEYVSIDERFLYSMPSGVDEKNVVAIIHSATTASIGLTREARLKKGESVFVNGGAGNAGSAVLQLAVDMGARVIVTAGNEEDIEYCRSLGAGRAINYRTDDVPRALSEFAPDGIDVYWDTTTMPDFERAVPLLANRGRIILMAGMGARPALPVGPLYTKDCSIRGFAVTNATADELSACASLINESLARGKLHGRIGRMMRLNEAAAAHRLLEDRLRGHGNLRGKIVLTV